MASKRMISKRITMQPRFTKMPPSTQALYFHLNINADDDGIVEAYNILRMTGIQEDDLKVLIAKNFVKVINEDLVTYITDWNEHNKIRADRKVDSIYKDLLLKILPEINLLESKSRSDTGHITQAHRMDRQWTDNGPHRLDKISIDKNSIYIDVYKYWNSKEIIKHGKYSDQIAYQIKSSLVAYEKEEILKAIDNYNTVIKSDKHYFSHKWTLVDFLKRGLDRFVNNADPLNNFIDKTKKDIIEKQSYCKTCYKETLCRLENNVFYCTVCKSILG